ncbi:MAG: hypothetical protein J2P37_05880 [Ktedonobacteraceae bacterium]|nr:hypothetical protein [Ktedonobacteraceae bacterium]
MNIGQVAVGIILLLVVTVGLLYIFFSRTNAVQKTGYGSLIMLALVSVLIPIFWITGGSDQAAAKVQQHNLALERGMILYTQVCTDMCYGIKDNKVVNATYNGYTIADLNKLSDNDLRRIISAGVFNPASPHQPANANAVPKSDQYGGALLSNDIDYLFELIRSDDPSYLQKNQLPAGSGFSKLPEYLQNNNPTLYDAATKAANPVDFGEPVDKTSASTVSMDIVKADPSIKGCKTETACFQFVNIKVKVGQKITWTNKDVSPHTVTAITGTDPSKVTPAPQIFDSGKTGFSNGQSFTYTVTQDAYNLNPDHTVIYYCSLHPDMLAKLTIVQ